MTHPSSKYTAHDKKDGSVLRIALVVDSLRATGNISKLVSWCQKQENLHISHLVICRKAPAGRDIFRAKCFAWMTWLESKLVRDGTRQADAANHDLSLQIQEIITLGSSSDLKHSLEGLQLDLFLLTGTNTLPDGIGSLGKLGTIRIDHKHSHPIGFWEAYTASDYTGFSISRIGAASEPDTMLIGGRITTSYCYSLNRKRIEQKHLHYIKQVLFKIALNLKIPENMHTLPLEKKDQVGMPGLPIQISYIFRLCFRQIRRVIRRVFRQGFKWSVAYSKNAWQDADMAIAVKIPRPDRHFLADPFVITENGRDYCFLEDYDFDAAKGHVAVYQLLDDRAECLGNALVEPFHLSFPYLFRYQSELYMCPETSRNRQIRVYKCESFPLKWPLHTVLMDAVSAADSMLFERDGRWWMLTNQDVAETGDYCTELSIYWADSPLSSQWIAHPANPVCIDASKARNAGLLIDHEHIYRVAQQQGFERYGKAFSINRIDVLNEYAYQETEIRKVSADFFKNSHGTHHMHSNGSMTVFDFN